jgi:hypothetical protein
MADDDIMFNVSEAAQHYHLSASWLNKLRITGEGCPYLKLGRRVFYRKSDFDAWVAARLRTSTSGVRRRKPEAA